MELRGLNDKQLQAVKATEGRVRIIAGAGSGKTRVLAHRYAYLVDELGIDPGNILCLTFTNKAAAEMRHRINSLIGGEHASDFICTIHSFCVKFLREEIFRLGYPKTFQILDEEDMKAIVKEAHEENGLDRKVDTTAIESIIERIISENQKAVEDFKNGKEKAKQALFGACMKELKGAGDPGSIKAILDEKLNNL